MSIAVVVKKGQYVAIGSDTLTIRGYTIKETADYVENHSKILRVGTSYIVPVGPASANLVLSSYFSSLRKIPVLSSPKSIFEEARKMQRVLKDKYFLRIYQDDDDEFESLRLSCLIANPWGIFGLHRLRSVHSYTKFWAFGSGGEFALGAMRAVYNRLRSAEQIAREGLAAATEFEYNCAPPVEIKTVKLRKR